MLFVELVRKTHSPNAQPYSRGCTDTKSWRSADVRTEPMRTPSDDETYITWTLRPHSSA